MIKFTSHITEDNPWGFYILNGDGSMLKPITMVSHEIKDIDDNHVTIIERYIVKRIPPPKEDK